MATFSEKSQRVFSTDHCSLAKIGVDTAENEPCKVCPLSACIIIITDPPGLSRDEGKQSQDDWEETLQNSSDLQYLLVYLGERTKFRRSLTSTPAELIPVESY